MSTKRVRRSLSLAGSDAVVKKRSRPSSAAANAEAAAAAAAAQQAAAFDNLNEADNYHNWFPRQAGFNTLSKSQINKDLRELTNATHQVPVESEDEELDANVYSLYDAALVQKKVKTTHQPPDVLQDIWSNELLYYRWRCKKRAYEMHEIIAQRRQAWENYIALRASLVEEIRRLGVQQEQQDAVLDQLRGSRRHLQHKVNQTKLQLKAIEAERLAQRNAAGEEKQRKLIVFLVKQQKKALAALAATEEVTTAAASGAADGSAADAEGVKKGVTDGGTSSSSKSGKLILKTKSKGATRARGARGSGGSNTSGRGGGGGAGGDNVSDLREAVETILGSSCPAPLAELYEQFKSEANGSVTASSASASSTTVEPETRRSSSRLQGATPGLNSGNSYRSHLAGNRSDQGSNQGKNGAGGRETRSSSDGDNTAGTVIFSGVAPTFPRDEELHLSPIADNDAQILMAASFTEEQRRCLAEHTDLGRWEEDRIELAKCRAANAQMSNELMLLQDRDRKQRRALSKRTEECARFAKQIAKVRADFAKRKRRWETRAAEAKRAHDATVARVIAKYDPEYAAKLPSLAAGVPLLPFAPATPLSPAMTRSQLAAKAKLEEAAASSSNVKPTIASALGTIGAPASSVESTGASGPAKPTPGTAESNAASTASHEQGDGGPNLKRARRTDANCTGTADDGDANDTDADGGDALDRGEHVSEEAARKEAELVAALQASTDELNRKTKEKDTTIAMLKTKLANAEAEKAKLVAAAAGDSAGSNGTVSEKAVETKEEIAALRLQLQTESTRSETLQAQVDDLSTQLTQYVNENSHRVRPRRNRR